MSLKVWSCIRLSSLQLVGNAEMVYVQWESVVGGSREDPDKQSEHLSVLISVVG